MSKVVDDLSKNLAGGMTRRRALTVFAAGVAGSVAFWKKGDDALAYGDLTPCNQFCQEVYGPHQLFYQECLRGCRQQLRGGLISGHTICPPGTVPIFLSGTQIPGRTVFPFAPFGLCIPSNFGYVINSSYIG